VKNVPNAVKKSIEMSDVEITFLSLVDKAANKHQFLVVKSKDGKPQVKFSASILKSDATAHEITGIVYEPLTADAHDNFMTPEEIQKAADWFDENGLGSDLQHNGQTITGVEITKSWVVEENTEINGTVVKAGTWLATAKIENDDIWSKIEKGEITGWSMGGVGNYSTADVDISSVEKSLTSKILAGIAKALGFTFDGKPIEETSFTEEYNKANKYSSFWNAWNTLQDFLIPYDNAYSWETHFQENQQVITSALQQFSDAIVEVLASNNVAKALEPSKETIAKALVNKSGQKMNAEQVKVLDNISKELSVLKGQFTADSEEGEDNMKPEEIKKAVTEAVTAAVAPIQKELDELKKTSTEAAPATEEVAKAEGEDMAAVIKAAVAEALAPVQKDLDAVKKAKGISKQLETDDDVEEVSGPVTKSVFAGMFGSKQ